MGKKRKSKRYILTTELISIFLLLASISFMIVGGLLHDHGYGEYWWPAVGLSGFFACDILAIILLIRIAGDAVFYEAEKKNIKYDAVNLFKLNNLLPQNIAERFLERGFADAGDGYYRRKVFSFSKDTICYYTRWVSAPNISETVEHELEAIDALGEKSANVCLILFMFKSDVYESDLIELREISKFFIIDETVLPMTSYRTSIVILVNGQSREGVFLDMNSKISISIYAHGCRLIKKYFPDDHL